MSETLNLKQFFRDHAAREEEEFLDEFPGGFLLGRLHSSPPILFYLPPEDGFTLAIGSDEDCDLGSFGDPTMAEQHAKIAYHKGFAGWTVEDLGSSFGTVLDGEALGAGRATLMQDRSVVKPGGYTELQFYHAKTLYRRMNKAGVTRSMRRREAIALASSGSREQTMEDVERLLAVARQAQSANDGRDAEALFKQAMELKAKIQQAEERSSGSE